MKTSITTREFFRSPRKVAGIIMRGDYIQVNRLGKPFFDVIPKKHQKGLIIKDFKDLIFKGKKEDTNLSRQVDDIVYGIK